MRTNLGECQVPLKAPSSMYALRNPPSNMRCMRDVAQYEERLTELATKENHRERNVLYGPDSLSASMGSSSASTTSIIPPIGGGGGDDRRACI